MSSSSVGKILVTNSTNLSLNDRFTGLASSPNIKLRRRSRSTSVQSLRQGKKVANRRLLQELTRKDKMQAALKLKRRSIRPNGPGHIMKRGTVKALRVAPSGKPIKANSLTKFATMNADLVSTNNYNRPLRRSNSMSNVAGRLGGTTRRSSVGGAAQRIANRNLEFSRGRGRASRSRSRSRLPILQPAAQLRARSVSRGRMPAGNTRRERSRSRIRAQNAGGNKIPVQARLGLRPGKFPPGGRNSRGRTTRALSANRGVAAGRIQKRSNSSVRRGKNTIRGGAVGGRIGRARGRSATRNVVNPARSRSRSRIRKGSVGSQQLQKQQQQQSWSGNSERGRRRGRSQQRNGRNVRNVRNGSVQSKGKLSGSVNGKQQQQQRRGRSRSRGRGVTRGGARNNDGRNLGKTSRPDVNKDELDKELEQYMATTKSVNDMEWLKD